MLRCDIVAINCRVNDTPFAHKDIAECVRRMGVCVWGGGGGGGGKEAVHSSNNDYLSFTFYVLRNTFLYFMTSLYPV